MNTNIELLLSRLKIIKPKGFPCFTALFINDKFINFFWNKKFNKQNGNSRHHNHAEHQLLKLLKEVDSIDKITLIQTMPPCFDCLQELLKLERSIKIIYLFDPYLKHKKKNWKNKKNIILKRIDPQYTQLINYAWRFFKERYFTKSHNQSRNNLIKKWQKFNNIKYGYNISNQNTMARA